MRNIQKYRDTRTNKPKPHILKSKHHKFIKSE